MTEGSLAERLAAAVDAGMPGARDDLARLVALRSVANPAIEPESECRAAAALVGELFTRAGVDGIQAHPTPDGSLAVVGRTRGPAGAPTVLLYSHYDVVPVGDLAAWSTPPWELTERDGRWYGRGSADCKGNLVASLLALRALRSVLGSWPVEVAVVCEGSEEQSSGGMEGLARSRPDLVQCDALLIADTGNVEAGLPTLTTSLRGTGSVLVTVRTMSQPAHSGMYGGPAPDALQALLTALASLRDADGQTTIDGLSNDGVWDGAPFDTNRFRDDAGLLEGVEPLVGDGTVADLVWARPAATVLAIDCPPISQVTAAVQGEARAVVNLRVPADTDAAAAQQLLTAHLRAHTPYGQVEVKPVSLGQGFRARTDGPAYAAMRRAMHTAFGREPVTTGQGGSIPLATALAELVPDAEIMLLGVEEPASRIHSPGESVDPEELRRTALAQALFLAELGAVVTP
ncbi:Acetylornithine deacetylase/Succinyl-diaminopimelate desuccinylase [Pedococcus dokdonensis]|uniref:Acetylornithine deacetylase/Succinyl-diaminopimelate desuccinylase n=1 Tax=Pedococcus dokdonensis TaxID=443156 RepID=A0A1H0V0H6_9MICO|nr:M20/M25/M40 family metallo-hydrolase [Pedococcus dokdonensis]SDP71834.1 Acetylornithine deacetylase/Succinyl-diaminopimelate desuccinylase [Pedococcus dokdonensis]